VTVDWSGQSAPGLTVSWDSVTADGSTENTVEAHVNTIFSKLGLEPAPDDNRRVLAVLTFLASSRTSDDPERQDPGERYRFVLGVAAAQAGLEPGDDLGGLVGATQRDPDPPQPRPVDRIPLLAQQRRPRIRVEVPASLEIGRRLRLDPVGRNRDEVAVEHECGRDGVDATRRVKRREDAVIGAGGSLASLGGRQLHGAMMVQTPR